MAKTATVRARVDPALKQEAERVLDELGLTPTAAITLYYEQIVKRRGIPFDLSLPNETTLRAMRDAETGHGVARAANADDLFAKLNAND